MKIMKKKLILISSAIIISIAIITNMVIFLPNLWDNNSDWEGESLISDTAATHLIITPIETSFSTYTPLTQDYTPSIKPTEIKEGLTNVDKQGLSLSPEIEELLANYGFALIDEGYDDIYDLYDSDDEIPKFITTDLCLHAFHVLYDVSLRILEGERFFDDFESMLIALRDSQIALNSTVTESVVHDAITKNIAYLSVMLFLLNETNVIPVEVEELTLTELDKINSLEFSNSAIFGYEEDYSQYKVRGHYTRNDILGNYFKAVIYAGRMGFQFQSPSGEPEMGIEHTRMALLLISSFNTTIGESETVWDYFDRIYEPTVFYVGASDDLTAEEMYTIWQNNSAPAGNELANTLLIESIIDDAKNYRRPKINSMIIMDNFEAENVTQGFRLMGQRFIPDSYIFQQLVHNKVFMRLMPTGLDVFSVFGSPRAANYTQEDVENYPEYQSQIQKLRTEFNNLTSYDWTQNLYWMWLYSLFPLLEPASEGYPGFMLSDAWSDKALMTALGSWAELRHDTILYAKQSYTQLGCIPTIPNGYVEPYPELYSRLSSLVKMLREGLEKRGLLIDGFSSKLADIEEIFQNLAEISVKELENEHLTEEDIIYINNVGKTISFLANFNDPEYEKWVSGADDRMAVIADVHTDPNSMQVLEVGTGDPFVIYVVIQDHKGNLRLARGGTFSYYEFTQTVSNRLSDEEWQEMLDTTPPDYPDWMKTTLPITLMGALAAMVVSRKEP